MVKINGIFALVTLLAALASAAAGIVRAQSIEVKDAWVRGTVPAQRATGAFMEITGKNPVRLVGAASPVAGTVEIHNMTVTNGVMRMFPVDGIDVPAGKTVKLAPGGYHVMFMGLKQQVKAGDKVPLDLLLETADKKRETVSLQVEVRDITSSTGSRSGQH